MSDVTQILSQIESGDPSAGKPTMQGAATPDVTVNFPPDATGDIHIILEVTDIGQPPLTSYRRVVVTVD